MLTFTRPVAQSGVGVGYFQAYMRQVYLWMAVGLAVTSVVALRGRRQPPAIHAMPLLGNTMTLLIVL